MTGIFSLSYRKSATPGFLTRIEGLNEVRGLKNQVSASRTIVKTRVVQEFVPDVKRGFYNKRAYG